MLRISSDVYPLLRPFRNKALFYSHQRHMPEETLSEVYKGKLERGKEKRGMFEIEKDMEEAFSEIFPSTNNMMMLSRDSIYQLLRRCIEKKKCLSYVRKIHCLIIINGLEWIGVLMDHLIRAYSCSGCLSSSNQVFSRLSIANIYTWNMIISAHVSLNACERAFDLYSIMPKVGGITPDKITFLGILQACASVKCVKMGQIVHGEIVCAGLDSVRDISSSLVHMYLESGFIVEGHKVFNGIMNQDVVSWGALISGYAQFGHNTVVLELFKKLQEESIQPDRGMYMCFIKCCSQMGDIEWARKIHGQVRESVLHSDITLASAIIDMYSACGSLKEACEVFEAIPNHDVVTWGAMMSAYIQHGLFLSALRAYEDMQQLHAEPDHVIFSFIIKACINAGSLVLGRWIHADVIRRSLDSYQILTNSLIDLYMKFGCLEEANSLFIKASEQDVASWDIVIGGYLDNGHADIALTRFYEMKNRGLVPNKVTYLWMLKVCSRLLDVTTTRFIHDEIIRGNLESDMPIGNAMVDMYVKCQLLQEAERVFDSLLQKDVVTWAALIGGFAQSGDARKSLDLLQKMKQEGVVADEIAYLGSLKAIGNIRSLKDGHVLHDQIIRCRFESHNSIKNSLVDMYAKCGTLDEAHKQLISEPNKDVITWGAMLGGYAQYGHGEEAFSLFEQMQQGGLCPDQATFVCILKACGRSRTLEGGQYIHDLVLQSKFSGDKVIGNALIDMYVKCGDVCRAYRVFETLPSRDIVSWSSMICGYARHGFGHDALDLYEQMHREGLVEPSRVLFLCTLKACASIGAVEYGQLVHEHIRRSGLELDTALGNSLLNLHVQYGGVGGALEVFEELSSRDVVSWTVMMAGFASQGDYPRVIRCFHMMLLEGLVPDDIAFTTALEACNNAALLQEVVRCFESMTEDHHRIAPKIEHYNCLSSTLAQRGMGRDAFELMRTIPWTPDSVMWMSLLKSCSTYGDEEAGCCYFGRVRESSAQVKDPSNSSPTSSASGSLPIGSYGFSEPRDSSKLAHITHMEDQVNPDDSGNTRFLVLDLGKDVLQPQGALDISNNILLRYRKSNNVFMTFCDAKILESVPMFPPSLVSNAFLLQD